MAHISLDVPVTSQASAAAAAATTCYHITPEYVGHHPGPVCRSSQFEDYYVDRSTTLAPVVRPAPVGSPGSSPSAAAHEPSTAVIQATLTIRNDIAAVFFLPEAKVTAAGFPAHGAINALYRSTEVEEPRFGSRQKIPHFPAGLIAIDAPSPAHPTQLFLDDGFYLGSCRAPKDYESKRPVYPHADPHSHARITAVVTGLNEQLPFPIVLENYTGLPPAETTSAETALTAFLGRRAEEFFFRLYRPSDECTSTASRFAFSMRKEGMRPISVFIHANGQLLHAHNYWTYHTACGLAGTDGIWVLEPLISTKKPVALAAWLQHVNCLRLPISIDIVDSNQREAVRHVGFAPPP